MMRKFAIVAALALALAPATARADWLFTPNIGSAFGGDVDANFTYGASLAWMTEGIFGAEVDFQFTPDALGFGDAFPNLDLDTFDSSARSVMGNVIVGIPFGGTSGLGFRPYVVGGLGYMSLNVSDELEDLDLFQDDTKAFAIDVGAGATGFFTDNVGVRGDVRWYRGFVDDDNIISPRLDDFQNLDFWRATGGVTFRW